MRINREIQFPYPVLGIGNSMKGSLSIEDRIVEPTLQGNTYVFKISVSMPNEDILNYIREGFAEFSFEINCPSTYYRDIKTSELPETSFFISQKPNGNVISHRHPILLISWIPYVANRCDDRFRLDCCSI